MFRWAVSRSQWLAFGWLLFITILFCLPGSALPKENWFTRISFDKWAHAGVFAVLLFLFCAAYSSKTRHFRLWLLIIAGLYGMTIELIQKFWIPHRDFDLLDFACDMAGGMIGLWIWWLGYKKNKPL